MAGANPAQDFQDMFRRVNELEARRAARAPLRTPPPLAARWHPRPRLCPRQAAGKMKEASELLAQAMEAAAKANK